MVVLATQTPATRVLNGPQPKRACVTTPSGCCNGAGVRACAEETRAKPATVTAINLNIFPTFGFVGPFQELGSGAPVSLPRRIFLAARLAAQHRASRRHVGPLAGSAHLAAGVSRRAAQSVARQRSYGGSAGQGGAQKQAGMGAPSQAGSRLWLDEHTATQVEFFQ
jgi:hypothetical protein